MPGLWSSISINLSSGEKVTIAGSNNLTNVILEKGNLKIEVQKSELEGIEIPQLKTTEVLFGYYYHHAKEEDNHPYIVIELHFGEADKHGQFPLVQFIFSEGKLLERSENIPTGKNSWQCYTKKIGEKRIKDGTLSKTVIEKSEEKTEQDASVKP